MTLRAAVAPAVVLTLTAETADRPEVVLRPISDAAAAGAKLWFDCTVTRPWTTAEVVPACDSVTVEVPPAASVPVPAKLASEMLSPDALVRISLPDELTLALTPVVPVAWLIALTKLARPACVTLVTDAEIVAVLVCAAPVPLPRVNEIEPA